MTIDQIGSTRRGDQVEPLLEDLRSWSTSGRPPVRAFERTGGDEVQAVLDDADRVVDLALILVRRGGWSIGIGAGPVDEPLPPSTRAGTGPAFVHARDAVERAKSRSRPVPLAVVGHLAERAADAEAVLGLVAAVVERRSPQGWAVIDALGSARGPRTQEQVAADLGISQQAVSQRLRAAMWAEERAARPVAARLLREGEA